MATMDLTGSSAESLLEPAPGIGPHGWYGHVDNRYDPRHGYHGPLPERGSKPFTNFHPNEARDGQGHVAEAKHSPANEHSGGYEHGGGGAHGGGHH